MATNGEKGDGQRESEFKKEEKMFLKDLEIWKISDKWESPNGTYKLTVVNDNFFIYSKIRYELSPNTGAKLDSFNNLIIEYKPKNITLKKVNIEDRFKFYQWNKDQTKYAALKVDNNSSLGEHCILIYFTYKYNESINITDILTAEKSKDRIKINSFCSEIISEWVERNFIRYFCCDRQKEIENKINEKIHELIIPCNNRIK